MHLIIYTYKFYDTTGKPNLDLQILEKDSLISVKFKCLKIIKVVNLNFIL